jgi:hypothetical protein
MARLVIVMNERLAPGAAAALSLAGRFAGVAL